MFSARISFCAGVLSLASCNPSAPPAHTSTVERRPAAEPTEWLAGPAQGARVIRVEAGLAPFSIPGQVPVQLSLQRWMELYKIPGLSVAVFDHGEILWAKSYGVKQIGQADRVTNATLFQAASISKVITALAALHFVEKGRWSLDEDINDRLRSWKMPASDLTRREKVTLRRLLSHSSGLAEHHGFPGYAITDQRPTVPQILEGMPPANAAGARLDSVPGSATRYNGAGFVIVQLMMEDQLGKPFPEIVRETVFEPLGLTLDTFEQPLPAARAASAASGTTASGEMVEGRWHVYPEMGPAGWWTTASDLAVVAIEVSRARAGRSRRIVSQAMATQMLTPQSDGFGLGFELGARDRFGHTGSNRGFKSELIVFGDTESGVALLANSDSGSMLFGRIVASIANEYGWESFVPTPDSASVVADLLARIKGTQFALAWVRARHSDGAAIRLSSNVLNGLGYRLLAEHHTDDACTVFATNVELYPNESNSYDSLGECYVKAGRRREAAANYHKALELDPSNTNARRVLESLEPSP